MELRDAIRDIIREAAKEGDGYLLDCQAETYAAEVLAIPEIAEALGSQCSRCDGARGPLLCTECVRDFVKTV